jgi:autoinducer 2-degrading protein
MIVNCVYVRVLPEHVERFIALTKRNHTESVKEPGNLRFDVIQQADDKSSFMLYEAWVSDEAAAAHKLTPHYATWKEEVEPMMAEPRKGVRYKIIQPAGSEW